MKTFREGWDLGGFSTAFLAILLCISGFYHRADSPGNPPKCAHGERLSKRVTGNHDGSNVSLLQRFDDWSCLDLQLVLENHKSQKCQITLDLLSTKKQEYFT